jgi:hypothetical protein
MGILWLAVIYAALRHPITFLRGFSDAGVSGRDATAAHLGMTRKELDELIEEMGE